MSRGTAIRVRDIRKSFGGSPAVDGVSFDVDAGESVAIIGPNGAGKSTLFGLTAGEHRPDAGRVLLDGRDATRWTAARRCRNGLSRTFQVASFFASRTVRENVEIACVAVTGRLPVADRFARGSRDRESRIDEVLDLLDLTHLQSRLGRVLAQGDRKRLEFAMALVQRPQVLLLDEPTAGMSNEDIHKTIEMLLRVRRENSSLAVVLTAHDMDVVFAVCERVMLMGQGKLLLDGSPREVETHPITRSLYLGSKEESA
ncbi:ABC transporter ATP-binding protein [Streptomyces solisilvae]|uniref:ABC transporter ATP-binding protein n=1 Tax=Streptomyces malaysiensis TaxID=92644 RepID=UPI0036B42147